MLCFGFMKENCVGSLAENRLHKAQFQRQKQGAHLSWTGWVKLGPYIP